MSRTVRGLTWMALALPAALPAQGIYDSQFRLGPQYASYSVKAPVDETISQLSLPFFFIVPVGGKLSIDVGTAWASSRVETSAGASEIAGLTDTQIRANYAIGTDFMVLTLGVNVPTGSALAGPAEQVAANRIGSDFFTMPIPSMGTGFGLTGGLAIAKPLGDWNLGVGFSVRHASAFDAFEDVDGNAVQFQPGDEYRVRVGVDRTVGTGRAALGVTYSVFGDNMANESAYNTGNRLITQALFTRQMLGGHFTAAMWDVYRASGTLPDSVITGAENIASLFLGLGWRPGGTLVEPNVELRNWAQESGLPSTLVNLGVRTQFQAGPVALWPSVRYAIGRYGSAAGSASVSGLHAMLAVRLGGR